VKRTKLVLLFAVLAGCGSVEQTEPRKDPVSYHQPLDSPPAEEGTSPPFGRPRDKVAPSATDKRTESLTSDTTPH
jgi:hypothetical protein